MYLIRPINNLRLTLVKHAKQKFNLWCQLRRYLILTLGLLIISGCQTTAPGKIAPQTANLSHTPELPNSEQAQRYEKAIKYLQAKDYPSATTILTELSQQRPNFAGSWVNLGLIKLMTKEPVEAKNLVARALTLVPKHPQALNLMGLIATHDRDIKLAEGYYLKAIESSKQYANAHYNLAMLYDIYLQDIRSAVKHYQKYLQYVQIEDKQTQGWVEHLQASLND